MTIADYLKEKKITRQEFCNITGICYSRIGQIMNEPSPKMDMPTMIKIWEGTKKRFGTGLTPWEFIKGLPEFYKE